jgi:hypothetical protein
MAKKPKPPQPLSFVEWVSGPGAIVPEVVLLNLNAVLDKAFFTTTEDRESLRYHLDGDDFDSPTAERLGVTLDHYARLVDEVWRKYLLDVTGLSRVGGLSSAPAAAISLMEAAAKVALQGGLPTGDAHAPASKMVPLLLRLLNFAITDFERLEDEAVEIAKPSEVLTDDLVDLVVAYSWRPESKEDWRELLDSLDGNGLTLIRKSDVEPMIQAAADQRVAGMDVPTEAMLKSLRATLKQAEQAVAIRDAVAASFKAKGLIK